VRLELFDALRWVPDQHLRGVAKSHQSYV
jgi:hypothetical protein